VHAQLCEDLVDVGTDGIRRHPEVVGNLRWAAALRQAGQHVVLPGRQDIQRTFPPPHPADVCPQVPQNVA
jgi:hypothetical protein